MKLSITDVCSTAWCRDGGQGAVGPCAQGQGLPRLRAVAEGGVRLRAGLHQPDRHVEVPGRGGGQDRVRPGEALRPEPAAGEWAKYPDLSEIQAERVGDGAARAQHPPRAVVQQQRARRRIPLGDGGGQLQGIVDVGRRVRGALDGGVRLGQAAGHVAPGRVGDLAERLRQLITSLARVEQRCHRTRRLRRVGRPHQRCRMGGDLRCARNHKRDGLPGIGHSVALQRHPYLAGRAERENLDGSEPGRVPVIQHGTHAGQGKGGCGVQGRHPPPAIVAGTTAAQFGGAARSLSHSFWLDA